MATLPDPIETLHGDQQKIYEEMNARRQKAAGHPLDGPYVPLMHNPALAQKVEMLGYYMKFESKLPRDVYQFIVLSVGRRTGVAFEWVDHVDSARAAGLPEAVIQALLRRDPAPLPEPYELLARALDSILAFKSIPGRLQEKLIERFGTAGLVEIVVIGGFYQLIGVINQSFDVPLPPGKSAPF
jgi:4-carboxymuconolactone decarboxylase